MWFSWGLVVSEETTLFLQGLWRLCGFFMKISSLLWLLNSHYEYGVITISYTLTGRLFNQTHQQKDPSTSTTKHILKRSSLPSRQQSCKDTREQTKRWRNNYTKYFIKPSGKCDHNVIAKTMCKLGKTEAERWIYILKQQITSRCCKAGNFWCHRDKNLTSPGNCTCTYAVFYNHI